MGTSFANRLKDLQGRFEITKMKEWELQFYKTPRIDERRMKETITKVRKRARTEFDKKVDNKLKELFLKGCQSTFAPKSIEVTVGLIKTSDAPSPRFTLMGFLTKFLLSKNSAEIRKLNLPGFSCLAKPAPKPKLPNWILIELPSVGLLLCAVAALPSKRAERIKR